MKDRSRIMDDSLEKGGRDREWWRERRIPQNVCLVQKHFLPVCGERAHFTAESKMEKHMENLDFAELNSHYKIEFPKYQEKFTSVIFLENCYLMARARKAKYYHEVFGYDIVC